MSAAVALAPAAPGRAPLLAHDGFATPDTLWSLDVPALAVLVTTAAGLVLLVRKVRDRPGGLRPGERARLAGLSAGVATIALAVFSPLHGLADALFSAHMVQHLLLVIVGAPLAVRGLPPVVGRRWLGAAPWWELPAATAALVVVFTGWHAPALYELAVRQPVVHSVEHLTMLGAALAFWAAAARAVAHGRDLFAVGAIGASGLAGVALGALLALSGRAWYDVHAAGAAAWGLDPLADQQLGGMIMWVPGGAANLAAAAAVVFRFLQRHDEPGPSDPVPPTPAPTTYPEATMPRAGLLNRRTGTRSERGR